MLFRQKTCKINIQEVTSRETFFAWASPVKLNVSEVRKIREIIGTDTLS